MSFKIIVWIAENYSPVARELTIFYKFYVW